ncbi:hypothetical protein [Sphingobium bisphenolivorans]|nr:hypothetical protein [Sphingobium bisphenolivorans]
MTGDREEDGAGRLDIIRAHAGPVIGVIGLAAWLALLWFMFGDVL